MWSQQEFDSGVTPQHFRVVGEILPGAQAEVISPLMPPQRKQPTANIHIHIDKGMGIGLAVSWQSSGQKPNFVDLRPWSKKGAKKDIKQAGKNASDAVPASPGKKSQP